MPGMESFKFQNFPAVDTFFLAGYCVLIEELIEPETSQKRQLVFR